MASDDNNFEVNMKSPEIAQDSNGVPIDQNGNILVDLQKQTPIFTGNFIESQSAEIKLNNPAQFNGGIQVNGSPKTWSYIFFNKQTKGSIQFAADGDQLTTPSTSSVFFHEVLDHGLDFIKNKNTKKSSINGDPSGVYYHNQALKNVTKGASPSRNAKDHGN